MLLVVFKMLTNFLIALAIALLIVAVGGCLDYCWQSGFRRQSRETAAYWASHEVRCPNCDLPYPSNADKSQWVGSTNTGWSFACPDCEEQAEFRRTDSDEPEFVCYLDHPRRCLECSELFIGNLESACPICNTVRHVLAHNTARPESTGQCRSDKRVGIPPG